MEGEQALIRTLLTTSLLTLVIAQSLEGPSLASGRALLVPNPCKGGQVGSLLGSRSPMRTYPHTSVIHAFRTFIRTRTYCEYTSAG